MQPVHHQKQSTLVALVVTLGVLGSVTAVAAGAAYALGAFDSAPTVPVAAEHPETWDPILEPYVAFVERERGLTFEHPVAVRYADIAAEVAEDFAEQRAYDESIADGEPAEFFDPYGDAWRLLGLVDFGAAASSLDSTEESIVENAGAFYDPWFQEIVLPEGASEIELQVTIVHELTHALQDQNGMLAAHLDSNDEAQSRLALTEGDAERIAEAWFYQMTQVEQQDYLDAIGYDPDAPFIDPPNSYLDANFYISYAIGVPMVLTIIETEGEDALNQMLRSSEVGTTERFVDVLGDSNYATTDTLNEFVTPEGRGRSDGDLGALTWFAALAPAVGTEAAFDALVGYDADAFAIYDDESGRSCGRFQIFFDDGNEAEEFARIAAEASFETELWAANSVMIDTCRVVGDPQAQNNAVLFPLIAANEMALYHLRSGLDADVARCASIAQAQTIPVDRSLDDFAGYEVLVAESAAFVERCQ